MSGVWTVARREFRGFVDHPTAYVLAVAFLGLAFFLSFRSLFSMGLADLRSLFSLLPWLFAVYVPAVTMRSLAEERGRGTLEWLLTQPLGEVDLVAGKFLGNWLFVLATLGGTVPMALGVALLGDAPLGPMIAQYVGAALLAAQLVALGLFASSVTRNQITAFILATGLSFILVFAGLPFTLMGVPTVVAGVLSRLALIPHFESVARGVVDLRDVLYFVSTAGLFGALAAFMVARERLSGSRGAYRRLRAGLAAGAAAVVVLNLLGARIHGRLDLTPDRVFTLSEGTREVLEGLDDLVTVKLFTSRELPAEVQTTLRDVQDVLADYRRLSDGQIRVQELHPDENEAARAEAGELGIQEIQFNVLRADEFQVRNGWLGLAVQYADGRETIPFVDRTDDLEYRLTGAIASLTAGERPVVAFLSGFGSRSSFALPELNQVLEDRYEVRSVNLDLGDSVPALAPDSFDLIVFAGPTQEVSEQAAAALGAYFDAGGAGLLLLETNQLNQQMPLASPLVTGLEDLLEERGVRLRGGMAYDLRSNQTVSTGGQNIFSLVAAYPYWPVALPAGRHAATDGLEALTMAWPGPLQIIDSTRAVPLWTTTAAGGRLTGTVAIDPNTPLEPDPDSLAVQVLAAAVNPGETGEGGGGGRLVVVGDLDFITSNHARANPQNLVFAANAVDWLASDERLIGIRSKDRTPPPLVFESDLQRATLRWGNTAGVPLLIVVLGVLRAVARRRKAQELWAAVQERMTPRPILEREEVAP